jgi:rhodanese-related sulfurtransferase
MEKGIDNFLVIDTRSKSDYEREHIPGSINLPHRQMNVETTRHLPKDRVIVTYCWGTACNASTKGALNLVRLGF